MLVYESMTANIMRVVLNFSFAIEKVELLDDFITKTVFIIQGSLHTKRPEKSLVYLDQTEGL